MVEEKDREDAREMNTFLQKHAVEQAKKGISITYVARDEKGDESNRVIACYSTSVGHLMPTDMSKVVSPRMTIPVVYL
jgi:hypothetical protein